MNDKESKAVLNHVARLEDQLRQALKDKAELVCRIEHAIDKLLKLETNPELTEQLMHVVDVLEGTYSPTKMPEKEPS